MEPTGPDAALVELLAPVVDRVGWADTDREVAAWVREQRSARGLAASTLTADGLDLLRDGPVVVAEVTLDEVDPGASGLAVTESFVRVRAAIVVENTSEVPIDRVLLRLLGNGTGRGEGDRALVFDAQVDARPTTWRLDGPTLTVGLPDPLPPGRSARLLVHLAQRVPLSEAREKVHSERLWPSQTGAFASDDGYLVLGGLLPTVLRLDRSGAWDDEVIAANAEPAVGPPASWRVVLTAPASYGVVATGRSVARTSDGHTSTELLVAGGARDFSVVLVPDARVTETRVGATTLRVTTSGDEVPGAELLARAEAILRAESRHLGPLTQTELDVVEAPTRAVDGLDWPGVVVVDTSHKGRPWHASAAHEWALAHGLAHQWWGHEVGNDGLVDPWLDEGLATHTAALAFEDEHGRDAVLARHEVEIVEPLAEARRAGLPDLPAILPSEAYPGLLVQLVVQGRSALFFDQVRTAFGAEAWDATLQELVRLGRGTRIASPTVLELLRERAPEGFDVDALWNRWMAQGHGYEDLL